MRNYGEKGQLAKNYYFSISRLHLSSQSHNVEPAHENVKISLSYRNSNVVLLLQNTIRDKKV